MREITAKVFETASGVRFIRAQGGGFIPLISAREVKMNGKTLAHYTGIHQAIDDGYAELIEHLGRPVD